jgi:hypothetical protein
MNAHIFNVLGERLGIHPVLAAEALVLPAVLYSMSDSSQTVGPLEIATEAAKRGGALIRDTLYDILSETPGFGDLAELIQPVRKGQAGPSVKKYHHLLNEIQSHVPAKPLVGVELNPGPPKKAGQTIQANRRLESLLEKVITSNVYKAKSHRKPKKGSPQDTGASRIAEAMGQNLSIPFRPYTKFSAANFQGMNGLRLSGCQQITYLSAPASGNSIIVGSTAGRLYLLIDPTVLGGPLQILSKGFQRFRFRNIQFHFRSECSSNIGGSVIMGYTSDPYASNGSISGTTVLGLQNSIESNIWASASMPPIKLYQENLLYNYMAGTAPADIRLGNQGAFLIAGSTNAAANSTLGDIWMSYTIELYELGDNANLQYLCQSCKLPRPVTPRYNDDDEKEGFVPVSKRQLSTATESSTPSLFARYVK